MFNRIVIDKEREVVVAGFLFEGEAKSYIRSQPHPQNYKIIKGEVQ